MVIMKKYWLTSINKVWVMVSMKKYWLTWTSWVGMMMEQNNKFSLTLGEHLVKVWKQTYRYLLSVFSQKFFEPYILTDISNSHLIYKTHVPQYKLYSWLTSINKVGMMVIMKKSWLTSINKVWVMVSMKKYRLACISWVGMRWRKTMNSH